MGNCFSNQIGTRDYYESRGPKPVPLPTITTTTTTARTPRRRKSSSSLADSTSSGSDISHRTLPTQRRRASERISIVRPPPQQRRATAPHPRPTAAEYIFSSDSPRPSHPPRASVSESINVSEANIITVEPGVSNSNSPTGSKVPLRRRRTLQGEYSRSWVDMRQDVRREERRTPAYVRPYESLIHQVQNTGGAAGKLGGTVRPGGAYKIQLPEEMLKELFYRPAPVPVETRVEGDCCWWAESLKGGRGRTVT